ncbi:DUF4229 domain-containing protein [Compostimonas suwonensis]|uniref:Uncharacterized protein DUF4229 n=1 Tax=Compostimonas suwonensis TaxID=1048394 RepID=A0A2M9C3B3_9MICO|nr:DUF4229 domain-containing protein [Compostimonas suwonensis]PJJ65015.1 uncharacterized protein DUF4229 [Compostimonas suwonensis]
MKSIPAWLVYTLLRVLAFAAPLAILLVFGVIPWIATVIAAIVGLCVSYIFLRKPLNAASLQLYEARHREHHSASDDDDADEDAEVDRVASSDPEARA